MLEGPNGPVSHLICGGVYDWSTGLIYRGGRYFDPNLGIWLALTPLLVVQGWRKRKDKRQWVLLLCVGLFAVGSLAGCESDSNTPAPTPTVCGLIYLPFVGRNYSPPSSPPPIATPPSSPPQTPPPPSGKIAYLTFDDGPEPQGYSAEIAQKLANEGIQTTFFLIGADPGPEGMQRILGFPDDVRAIRDNGHAVGIHGWFHNDWTTPNYDYLGDVQRTHQALLEVLDTLNDKLIRAPGGAFPDVPFEGYKDWYYYHWSPEGNPGDTALSSAKNVVTGLKETLGDNPPNNVIILLHSIRKGTYDAIVNPTEQGEEGDDLIWLLKHFGYTQFRKLPRPGDPTGTVIRP